MTKQELRYVTGSVHSKTLVVLVRAERVSDLDTAYALRDEILSLIEAAAVENVVLDLQRVTFVGSMGLLAFLAVRRRLGGGLVVICSFSETVRGVFEVCHLVSRDPAVSAPFLAEASLEAALARCGG